MTNLEKYKSDLKSLIEKGDKLFVSMNYNCHTENIKKQINNAFNDEKKKKNILKTFFLLIKNIKVGIQNR